MKTLCGVCYSVALLALLVPVVSSTRLTAGSARPPVAPAPRFRIRILPLEKAHAINTRGDVAGTVFAEDRKSGWVGAQAAVYSGGRLRKCARVGSYRETTIGGINDSGQVVGTLSTTTSGAVLATKSVAVLWEHDGAARVLSKVPGSGQSRGADGINNRGQIVGTGSGGTSMNFAPRAFLSYRGKVSDLGGFAAAGINARGEVIGTRYVYERGSYIPTPVGVLRQNGKLRDLGTRQQPISEAISLNNNGQIVCSGQSQHALLWEKGKIRDLGPVQGGDTSEPYAINDRGQIVGSGSDSQPFLWQKGKMYRLDRLVQVPAGFVMEEAVAINSRGQIVGNGYFRKPNSSFPGHWSAYLLTPR